MQKIIIKLLLIIILIIINCNLIDAQQTKSKQILTNEDFPAAKPTSSSSPAPNSEKPVNSADTEAANSNDNDQTIKDAQLQFKLYDLLIAEAENPDDRAIKSQITELKAKLRNSIASVINKRDIIDLSWRERFVAQKIAIIYQEQALKRETEELNKKILYLTSKDIEGAQLINQMRGEIDKRRNLLAEMQRDLDSLVEEGRKAGVGARAFY